MTAVPHQTLDHGADPDVDDELQGQYSRQEEIGNT